MFQFHKVRLKVIERDNMAPVLRLFQFHKVRLKVRTNLGFERRGKFQFHKVRLKVIREIGLRLSL